MKEYSSAFFYKSENYTGPIAINMQVSKEFDAYHKNLVIQINLNKELMEDYEKKTPCT
jgi:hypothetical protein